MVYFKNVDQMSSIKGFAHVPPVGCREVAFPSPWQLGKDGTAPGYAHLEGETELGTWRDGLHRMCNTCRTWLRHD